MSDGSQEKLLGEFDSHDDFSPVPKQASQWRRLVHPLGLACFLSVSLNIALLSSQLWPHASSTNKSEISLFAGLPRDSPMAFEPYSKYGVGNTNETDRSLMWERMLVGAGVVALDKQWAQEKNLPEAQDFPWDQSKSIYLLNGHHSLHCLRKVRRWVTISYHNGTQLDSYSHVVHCMSSLLQNILCEADDTPVYTTSGYKKDAGNGQQKQCRSWDALNEWAESQTACYSFLNETQGVTANIERYKYCPEGSAYDQKMHEILGLPSDWHLNKPSEIDSVPPYWEQFKHDEFVFHEMTDV